MTKTKPTDIALSQAEVKFTKAKAAVDGTPKTEKAYQKAKTELAFARQAHAVTRRHPHAIGNANVNIQAVAVKTGIKGE